MRNSIANYIVSVVLFAITLASLTSMYSFYIRVAWNNVLRGNPYDILMVISCVISLAYVLYLLTRELILTAVNTFLIKHPKRLGGGGVPA